jgi:hypothetical protein
VPILAQLGWAFCIDAQPIYAEKTRNFAGADSIGNDLTAKASCSKTRKMEVDDPVTYYLGLS